MGTCRTSCYHRAHLAPSDVGHCITHQLQNHTPIDAFGFGKHLSLWDPCALFIPTFPYLLFASSAACVTPYPSPNDPHRGTTRSAQTGRWSLPKSGPTSTDVTPISGDTNTWSNGRATHG